MGAKEENSQPADDQLTAGEDVVALLKRTGFPPESVEAAFDSLIDVGLEHQPQPDEGWLLTPDEVDALERQLAGAPSTCPLCGYDLGADGYPIRHQDTATGDVCTYEWVV